jgi:3-hydroxybutyryl-CoA dehydrogenase
MEYVSAALREMHQYAGLDAAILREWPERYDEAASPDGVASCDFVIESATEDLRIKRNVLGELDRILSASIPIGTNTSALSISTLQEGLQHPERLLGLHFAHPVYATRFLEVIPGERTAAEAMVAAEQFGRSIGKEPSILHKDVPGFIVNRLAYAMYREALHLIESGVADAETIDRAATHSIGIWASICGPLRWMDITGGPVQYAAAMAGVLPDLANASTLPKPLQELVAENARGSEHGHGFYEYTPQEAHAWEALLRRHVWNVQSLMNEYGPTPNSHVTQVRRST